MILNIDAWKNEKEEYWWFYNYDSEKSSEWINTEWISLDKKSKIADNLNANLDSLNNEELELNLKWLENKLKDFKAQLEIQESVWMNKTKELMIEWKAKEISKEEFYNESQKIQKWIDIIFDQIKKIESKIRILKTVILIKKTNKDYKNIFVDDLWIEKYYRTIIEWKNIKEWGRNALWVFKIPHTDFLLIQRSEESFGYIWNLTYYSSLFNNNTNLPRTLKTFVSWWKTYQIIEKAKWVQLDKINIALIENIPQKHFDKFVENILFLGEIWIVIDPSKQSNYFYDTNIWISIIDLSEGELNIKNLERYLKAIFTKWLKNEKIELKIKQALINNNLSH